jgi:protein phosphatase
MEWSAKSDVGLVRKTNEDSYIVKIEQDKFLIAIVADGMGGHQGGKIASNLSVDTIVESIEQCFPDDIDDDLVEIDVMKAVKSSIKHANEKVFNLSQEHQHLLGMGTTIVVALIYNGEVIIGHVGDSRAYIISGQEIKQITTDHSLVNELFTQGKISEDEALVHPQRNMITRAIGTSPQIDIDISKYQWATDDILLLCTDGLSEVVTGKEILDTFLAEKSIEEAVSMLLNQSLQIGGKDNITIVAIKNNIEIKDSIAEEGGQASG